MCLAVVERRSDVNGNLESSPELNGARHQYASPSGCQFEHLFEVDLVDLPRSFDKPRVSCENPVDVLVKLAPVGCQCRRKRNGGCIRTPTTECRHVTRIRIDTLEPRNDDDLSSLSASRIRLARISTISACPCRPFVRIPAWDPVNDVAAIPRS